VRNSPISNLVMVVALILIPASVFAQSNSNIGGIVRDTSGAVLPGVTVEAASPALIEKVRTVVTDSAGRYQVIAPGTMFGDRMNQLDFRVSKIFSLPGNRRIQANVDLFNALNASSVLAQNNTTDRRGFARRTSSRRGW